MSVAGELYRSYDSFVDGRMYQSTGSDANVPMHQAHQFIQSFGAYGSHVPAYMHRPKMVGIGMRIEKDHRKEFYVQNVNKNGSADRDGTIKPGDILVAVDGKQVSGNNMQTNQLRPLIMGPKGTYVKLTMKRYLPGDEEYTEFTLDLIRGDAMFFLEGENKAVQAKVVQLKQQLVEAEVELDSLRAVMNQANGRSRIDQREVEGIQKRYQNIQSVIERCNNQLSQEKQIQMQVANMTIGPQEALEANKNTVRQYHESLTRVEVQLSQVMADLEKEQAELWNLQESAEKENRLAEMVQLRLNQQSGYAHMQAQQDAAERERLHHLHIAHTTELQRLKLQIEQLRSRPKEDGIVEAEARIFSAEAGLAESKKEAQRMQMKLQMVQQVLNALDDENKRSRDTMLGLESKLSQTRSLTTDGERAIAHAQQAMEQHHMRWSAAYATAQEDRVAARGAAELRAAELRSQVLSLGEQNMTMQGLARDVLFRMESKEQEMVSKQTSLNARLRQRKADTSTLQSTVQSKSQELKDKVEEVMQYVQECAALSERERGFLLEAEGAKVRTEGMEQEVAARMLRENARASVAHALLEEQREVEGKLDSEIRNMMEEVKRLEQGKIASEDEIVRCREAIDRLTQHQKAQLQRSSAFRELHMRSIAKAQDGLLQAHNEMRATMQSVGTLSGDIIFTSSREATSSIVNSMHLLGLMHGEVFARRQREAVRAAEIIAANSVASTPREFSAQHTSTSIAPLAHEFTSSFPHLPGRLESSASSARRAVDFDRQRAPSASAYADEVLRQHLKDMAFSPHRYTHAAHTPPRDASSRDPLSRDSRLSPPRDRASTPPDNRSRELKFSPSRDVDASSVLSLSHVPSPNGSSVSHTGLISNKQAHERRVEHMASLM